MGEALTIDLFREGRWRPVAELRRIDDVGQRLAATHLVYDFDYAADHIGEQGFAAISVRCPVDFQLRRSETWPAFAVDLLPQGGARRLVDGRNRAAGRSVDDWNALRFGAGNPVGNLRVARVGGLDGEVRGVPRSEIVARGEGFREWARSEGVATTGSTDTGGAAPKLLLTEDEEGLLHADGALPDERARRHWLVKFPRGRTRRDAQVLANEAPYLEAARWLGLRCGDPLEHADGALFVPRFDRQVKGGVVRHGLESLYSALGVVDAGGVLAFEDVVAALPAWVNEPAVELCELVARDAVAWALGDTDNHGRNTALLKTAGGGVELSPLFDFAPMFLDPELIKRTTRWRSEERGEGPDWADVCAGVDAVLPDSGLRQRLRELGGRMFDLPATLSELGVDTDIVAAREPAIASTAAALGRV